jgi:hypothetical protein
MTIPAVKKADGTLELFNASKLKESLIHAGASDEVAQKVVEKVSKSITPGIRTSLIYWRAFSLLKTIDRSIAARYSLRRSLAELGPSGFPFERYIGEILKQQGYETEVGVYIKGKCALHEVDVVGKKDQKLITAEVKFHNQSKIKSDLKVALYVYARYLDLQENNFEGRITNDMQSEAWLVTNTKFTSHAIRYGECKELKMIGWSYPREGNLQHLIEKSNLEPLTTLTTLTQGEKKVLLNNGVVLCQTLRDDRSILKELNIREDKRDAILREADGVCHA